MKRTFILFIHLLIVVLCLQSCETLDNPAPREREVQETYSSYSYVAPNKKEMLLNEEFNNNARMWPMTFTTTQSHMYVANGLLNMMSNYGGPVISTIDLSSFTGNTNFEIEVLWQIEADSYSGGNRIIWGYDAASKLYDYLEINDISKQCTIGHFIGQVETKKTVSADNSRSYYYSRGYNKFTIRKVNNIYYYFVNDAFIYQEPFAVFKGSRIGFQVGVSSELNVDLLTVKELNL